MSTVPRRASFDDLRVGQVVAWQSLETNTGGWSGTVAGVAETEAWVTIWADQEQAPVKLERDGGWAHAEVFLLRDAPGAPVTVRREDYDHLSRLVGGGFSHGRLTEAIRALIDHADLGDGA